MCCQRARLCWVLFGTKFVPEVSTPGCRVSAACRRGGPGVWGLLLPRLLSAVSAPCSLTQAVREGSHFPTSRQYLTILVGVKPYLVVLICVFQITSDVEHLFMCLLAICISF